MKREEKLCGLRITSELRDEDGGVEEVAGQERRSAFRPVLTHFLVEAFVRQCW
jgi:hypothetical protein